MTGYILNTVLSTMKLKCGLVCSQKGQPVNISCLDLDFKMLIPNTVISFMLYRGDKFRTSFTELHTLRAFFQDVPVAAHSATLSSPQLKALPSILGLVERQVVSVSPDHSNIFLEMKKKDTSESAVRTYERVYVPFLKEVRRSPSPSLTFP